jgi:hypothetical protein
LHIYKEHWSQPRSECSCCIWKQRVVLSLYFASSFVFSFSVWKHQDGDISHLRLWSHSEDPVSIAPDYSCSAAWLTNDKVPNFVCTREFYFLCFTGNFHRYKRICVFIWTRFRLHLVNSLQRLLSCSQILKRTRLHCIRPLKLNIIIKKQQQKIKKKQKNKKKGEGRELWFLIIVPLLFTQYKGSVNQVVGFILIFSNQLRL